MMRRRWAIVAGLVGAFVAILGAGPVAATPPVTLSSGFVTDDADVLSAAQESSLNERLTTLSRQDGLDLYAVFVDDFTQPSDRQQWADKVAYDNGLGTTQYLLAVATEGRQYYISADSAGPISENRLDAIEQEIEPALRDGDWSGAVVKAADGFSSGGGAAGDSPWAGILTALLVLVIVGALIWLLVSFLRKRKGAPSGRRRKAEDLSGLSDEELTTRAGSALVHADDAITSSREDLGFATAQFGEEATAAFTEVVKGAEAKLSEAFSLKQKIDDEIPDTAEQHRAWRINIVKLCAEIDHSLESNVKAFDELRDLEKNAEEALTRVTEQRARTQEAVTAAPAALSELQQSYDAAALSTVTENPEHAASRLELADAHIAEAEKLLADGKRGEAAFAIRTAEEGVVQAQQLADAIGSLGKDLTASEQKAKALISDLEQDLAAAASMPATAELEEVTTATRALLSRARENLSGASRSPQVVLEALTAVNTRIDATMEGIRGAQERAARARQVLDHTMLQAQAQISAANDFIVTRRGTIGATARTRAAEATAEYGKAEALRTSDPEESLQHATRAIELAQQAIAAAQSDVSGFDTGFGGGGLGGGWGGGGGGNLGGDILGGILGGILAGGVGGSSSSSGWGGSAGSWRSSGGGRGFRPSSFGGGSRGRSGGGRF
ncbi:hypothetical protein GCM10025768_11300 [Microbacterium pseudoresistens]|uniref:TPM domain-containing protein n=1 Tax=Microbacterium pseudoresistens TaxID=640634 RepID=A0A7Y9EW33_9MICO|nr:TPM domain-containing protein [Microbacterium pseudoresistens]NYD55033.1 hypothetical protein [Microbacterium pseudoresistens]